MKKISPPSMKVCTFKLERFSQSKIQNPKAVGPRAAERRKGMPTKIQNHLTEKSIFARGLM